MNKDAIIVQIHALKTVIFHHHHDHEQQPPFLYNNVKYLNKNENEEQICSLDIVKLGQLIQSLGSGLCDLLSLVMALMVEVLILMVVGAAHVRRVAVLVVETLGYQDNLSPSLPVRL